MRAVVYRGPGESGVEDVEEPACPPGGLLVETAFVGLCGSDVRTWRNGNARIEGSQVLGHEVTGRIIETDAAGHAVGERVSVCPGVPCMHCEDCQAGRHNLCPFRRVLGYDFPGGMAERFAVPPEAVAAGCVVLVPERLADRHAALAEPLHTVLNGQDRAEVKPFESTLVLGLGPIGTFHAAVARSRGAANVLGLDPTASRVEAAASVLGATGVESLGECTEAELRDRGGRRGWDNVIVATGAHVAFDLAMAVVRPRGTILAFSGLPAAAKIVPVDMSHLHYQEVRLVGSFGGTPTYFAKAVEWLAQGHVDLDAMAGHVMSIEQVEQAVRRVEEGIGLKTLLVPEAGLAAARDELASQDDRGGR